LRATIHFGAIARFRLASGSAVFAADGDAGQAEEDPDDDENAADSESHERTDHLQTHPEGGPSRGELGLITTMYLRAAEHAVLEQLPAGVFHETRLSVPPLGVDVFEGALSGLVPGEAEFDDDESLESFVPPPTVEAEVTRDLRLTGGRLAVTTTSDIEADLAEYNLLPGGEYAIG